MINKDDSFVLVNLWGLGDLLASFHLMRLNPNFHFALISIQKKETVMEMASSLNLNNFSIGSKRINKFFIVYEIVKRLLKREHIFFTAPNGNNSLFLAKILKFFFKKVTIADINMNIYTANEKLFKIVK